MSRARKRKGAMGGSLGLVQLTSSPFNPRPCDVRSGGFVLTPQPPFRQQDRLERPVPQSRVACPTFRRPAGWVVSRQATESISYLYWLSATDCRSPIRLPQRGPCRRTSRQVLLNRSQAASAGADGATAKPPGARKAAGEPVRFRSTGSAPAGRAIDNQPGGSVLIVDGIKERARQSERAHECGGQNNQNMRRARKRLLIAARKKRQLRRAPPWQRARSREEDDIQVMAGDRDLDGSEPR